MKFLKKFQTDSDRTSFEGSSEYKEPYVSLVKETNVSHYNKPFVCKLTLNDGSSIKLYGNGQLTSAMISPYKETVVSAKIGKLCTSINAYTFRYCTAMTACTIGNDSLLTSIGLQAFQGCPSLTSINIPSGVTSIGSSAFNSCSSLNDVTCRPSTPPTLGSNAFNGTNNCPIYVPSESVEAYKAATNWVGYASRIQSIT